MTPKEKAIEIFEETEKRLLKEDEWITTDRVKRFSVHPIETAIGKYKKSNFLTVESNVQRVIYWEDVLTELNNLYK